MKKHVKRMLLVGGALVTTPLAACGGPVGNPKGCFYDDGSYQTNAGSPCQGPNQDAGGDASDASPFADVITKDAPSDAPADAPEDAPSDSPSDASDDGGG